MRINWVKVFICVCGIVSFLLTIFLFESCDGNAKKPTEQPVEPSPTPGPVEPTPSPGSDGAYKVGDIGPAGGIIVCVKDSYSEGWRYLEAAKDALPGKYVWGSFGVFNSKTSTNLGTGKNNTKILLDAKAEKSSLSFPAAEACADYGKGTDYNDWFLPSEVELIIMMTKLEEITGKTDTNRYWSSSEYIANVSWNAHAVQYEYVERTGYRGYNGYSARRTNEYYVRPVRSF